MTEGTDNPHPDPARPLPDDLNLQRGSHTSASTGPAGLCLMEAVAYFAGEPHSDRPGAITKAWPNVWVGVTAGCRSSLSRVAVLREVDARVRFVSCEPLLEHITADEWDAALEPRLSYDEGMVTADRQIDWLIVGDESGRGARHVSVDAVREARDAAARHGVAFHFKQWAGPDAPGISGARASARGKIHLPMLDGRGHAEFPR